MAHHQRLGVLDRKYIFEYDVGLWTLGTVQVLKDRRSGDLKTCKTVPKQRLRAPRDVAARLQRLQDLQHPHLCSISDVLEDQNRVYVISSKCAGGDVAEWMVRMQEEGNWLQEQTVAEYIRQALIATAHAHSHRVYHRDLRPSSLGLTSKMPDAAVKVMDFGLASVLDPEDAAVQQSPSPYAAPEVLTGFGRVVPGAPDMWSIGAIAHSLLVGHPPSQEEGAWSAGFLTRRSENDGWSERSAASRDFVRRLLQQAGERPTAARALQHPWLKGAVSLDAIQFTVGTQAARELQHRLLCYMLAVLLMPDCLQYRTFFSIRQSFAQGDADHDGFVARHVALKLLRDGGVASEVAAAALDAADVRRTDQFDLCAVACAELLAQELGSAGGQALGAVDLAPVMLRRFFQSYGDPKRLTTSVANVNSKLPTATMRDAEAHAGVRYDEILASLPEDGAIDSQTLAAGLTQHGGRGTPLVVGVPSEQDADGSWGEKLGMEGLGGLMKHVFQTCGLGHEKLRERGHRARHNLGGC